VRAKEKLRVQFHTTGLAKAGLAVALGVYFWQAILKPEDWRWLDGVNLFIHEAGHLVFRPFGEFMMIAGGSLFQVIMPALFVGYFLLQGQRYSAALVLFWVGESILNVSVYAADAISMELPLLGGSHVIHDWNYLMIHTGLLPVTPTVAGCIWGLGSLIIMLGLGLGLWASHPAITLEKLT